MGCFPQNLGGQMLLIPFSLAVKPTPAPYLLVFLPISQESPRLPFSPHEVIEKGPELFSPVLFFSERIPKRNLQPQSSTHKRPAHVTPIPDGADSDSSCAPVFLEHQPLHFSQHLYLRQACKASLKTTESSALKQMPIFCRQ